MNDLREFIEKGAALEHSKWSGWQEHLHSLCVKNPDGSLTIPKERVERWERQIKTLYADLPEKEKELDRIEVRKYIPLISALSVLDGEKGLCEVVEKKGASVEEIDTFLEKRWNHLFSPEENYLERWKLARSIFDLIQKEK